MNIKYIDLADRVARETETHGLYVSRILQWLDEHPNPTPVPTNVEKIEKLMIDASKEHAGGILEGKPAARAWAEYLDNNGVRAPEVGNE